jgi:hypothetical protein
MNSKTDQSIGDEAHRRVGSATPRSDLLGEFTQDLREFSASHSLLDLSDRTRRGLSTVGVLALRNTAPIATEISEKLGASFDDVVRMAIRVQVAGPWEYADDLKNARDPVVKAWMILTAVNTLTNERELDLTQDEFLDSVKQVEKELRIAAQDPEAYFKGTAYPNLILESQRRFRITAQGIPISELDNGFIAMAINGFHAGVVQDGDGLLFVGAKVLPEAVFEESGLTAEVREDRGRQKSFYLNDRGETVVKVVHPGFVIVMSRCFELAAEIAHAGIKHALGEPISQLSHERLGHKVYEPTSGGARPRESEDEPRITFSPWIPRLLMEETGNFGTQETFRADFYAALQHVKASRVFEDALAIKIAAAKQKGRAFGDEDISSLAASVQQKQGQKIEELRYLADLLCPHVKLARERFGSGQNLVDMAGGAGDLGIAAAFELSLSGVELSSVRIVDPFDNLRIFNRLIVEHLPVADTLSPLIDYRVQALQEAEIGPQDVVVAKHACGDLTDSIIEKWAASESKLLCVMTCCQEKAKDQPARYKISQDDWHSWCKQSAWTNDPKRAAEGMRAMTHLDEARVAYLNRHGFQAELIQTDRFPKGDVIIARRL